VSDNELSKIAKGKYADRLNFLRLNAQKTPAEEFYLLLNPADVESVAEAHFASRAYTLEFWRNGLILLPLFITWLSLGMAALAYIQTYSLSPDPFLKQWADGFPKATLPLPILSFIDVAAIDATLILILLLLTFFAQIIESDARKRAAQLRSWLDEELYILASSSLVKSLGEGPDNRQPAWAVEVHTAINHLAQALKGVEGLVQSSQQTLQNLVQTSQTTFNNLVDASQDKLEGSVREFRGAIGDQREAVEKFMSGTIEVRRAVDKLEKIYVEGEHIYQGLNATLPKIDQSFSTISTRQDAAATALESMSSQTNSATKAIGDIAAQFTQTQLVQSTYQAAMQMQQTAEIMRNVALQMGQTVNRQIQLQTHLEQQENYMRSQTAVPPYQNPQTTDPTPAHTSWIESIRQWFH